MNRFRKISLSPMRSHFIRNLGLVSVLLTAACTKEKDMIYEVNPVQVTSGNSVKNHVKNTSEFVSIAHADLFGTPVSQSELVKLNTVYTAFGDKKIVEDIIVKNYLNDPAVNIPSTPAVNGDTAKFITNTYKKFYNREPDVFEAYYMKEQVRLNASLDPLVIYYVFMTSDEYRFY